MQKPRLDPELKKNLIELQSLNLDNEKSVREKFLMPLIKILGYQNNDIQLDPKLSYPFSHKGTKKTKISESIQIIFYRLMVIKNGY
jgi:hypothetical protein